MSALFEREKMLRRLLQIALEESDGVWSINRSWMPMSPILLERILASRLLRAALVSSNTIKFRQTVP